MTVTLQPCEECLFAVRDLEGKTRCHRNDPVTQRGSDRAIWPLVDASAPGCGRFKPRLEEAVPL